MVSSKLYLLFALVFSGTFDNNSNVLVNGQLGSFIVPYIADYIPVAIQFTITPMTNYSNPDDTYSASDNTQRGHMLSGATFFEEKTYLASAVSPSVLFFVLGILSLIFLNFFLCTRCCCTCIRCFPNDKNKTGEEKEKFMTCHRHATYGSFYILIFLALVADAIIYFGKGYLDSGMSSIYSALQDLYDTFDDSDVILGNMGGYGDSMDTYVADLKIDSTSGSGCALYTIDIISTLVDTFTSSIGSSGSLIDPLLAQLSTAFAPLSLAKETYIPYACYGIFGLAVIAILLLLITHCVKTNCGLKFSMFVTQFIFFLILILNIFFCLFLAFISDFCMDPTFYLNSLVMDRLPDLSIVTFYTTCSGDDMISGYLSQAKNATTTLATILTSLTNSGGGCDPAVSANTAAATAIDGIASQFTNVGTGFGDLSTTLQCSELQSVYFKLMNDALCTGFQGGLYSIWISQIVTSFFLFVAVMVASWSYQHFLFMRSNKVYVDVDGEDVDKNYEGDDGAVAYADEEGGYDNYDKDNDE